MSEGVQWIGAVLAGIAAGLIPFFVSQSRNAMRLGWTALGICLIAGLLGGALLALPVCILFTIFALRQAAGEPAGKPLNYWSIAIPAGVLLWFGALGMVYLTLPAQFVSPKITVPLTMIALVLGGYVASGLTWIANRSERQMATDDLSSRLSSIGQKDEADRVQERD